MKICVIQPPYSTDFSLAEQHYQWELEQLAACDPSMDLIVLPEACDVPALSPNGEAFIGAVKKYSEPLQKAASETAARC